MKNYDICLIIKNHSIAKQLLSSFENKAIISHLIDRFPLNCRIIFSMAEGTSLLQQYIKVVYPQDRFVIVKDQHHCDLEDQERRLLLNCQDLLKDSFLLIQDPVWWQSKITTRENWMAVSIPPKRTESLYWPVNVSNDFEIKSFNQKKHQNSIYLGMSYILNHRSFWLSIEKNQTLLAAIEDFLKQNKVFGHFFSGWQELSKIAHESDELLSIKHQFDNQQVNIYLKATDCLKVIKKHDRSTKIFPQIEKCSLNTLKFPLPKGINLKTYLSPTILIDLCTYLERELWQTSIYRNSHVEKESLDFFLDTHRIIIGKFKNLPQIYKRKNDKDQSQLQTLLENIKWNKMSHCLPAMVHGNLCLKNIFYHQELKSFHLIDPSAALDTVSDLYCDLAKIYSSLRYHFHHEDQNIVEYEFYLQNKGLSLYKIKTLAALFLLEPFSGHQFTLFQVAKTLLTEAQSQDFPDIIPYRAESAK